MSINPFATVQETVDTSPAVADRVAYTTCYMCACRCGIKVHLKDGRIRYIEGNRDHPVNRGVLCAKGSAGIMNHYSPARLSKPLKRVGERGAVDLGQRVDAVAHVLPHLPVLGRIGPVAAPGRAGIGAMAVVVEARQQLVDRLLGASPAAAQLHQAGVHHDPRQPGRHPGVAGEAVEAAEGEQEGLLHGVAGVLLGAQHAPRDAEQPARALAHELLVGGVVACPEPGEQRRLVGVHARASRSRAQGRLVRGSPRDACAKPPTRMRGAWRIAAVSRHDATRLAAAPERVPEEQAARRGNLPAAPPSAACERGCG